MFRSETSFKCNMFGQKTHSLKVENFKCIIENLIYHMLRKPYNKLHSEIYDYNLYNESKPFFGDIGIIYFITTVDSCH